MLSLFSRKLNQGKNYIISILIPIVRYCPSHGHYVSMLMYNKYLYLNQGNHIDF